MSIKINPQKQIGEGHFGKVYVLDNDPSKVVKVFKDTASNPQSEFQAQLTAWKYQLAPQPLELAWTDDYQHECLVMERVYHLSISAFCNAELKDFYLDLYERVKKYHQAGYAHGDIQRPKHFGGHIWDNVLLSLQGIVLIDYGTAIDRHHDSPFAAVEWQEQSSLDLQHLQAYKTFLTRQYQ